MHRPSLSRVNTVWRLTRISFSKKDFDAIMAVLEEDEDLEDHFDKEVQEV